MDNADASRAFEKVFTLSLAAPNAPSVVTLNVSSFSNGLSPGQVAANLSATDPDSFDRHVYALVEGEGSSHNSLFTLTGSELKLASVLPAGITSLAFRIRATDLSGRSVETAFNIPISDPKIRINEILAVSSKATRPLDEKGLPQDWIELFNEQAQPVNLLGWSLTDDPDNLRKWVFGNSVIAPNGYLLIFASGTGAKPASGQIHTTFSLGQSGEPLLLVRPDGVIVSEVRPPEQFPNTSWGVQGSGSNSGYLRTRTPNALNSDLATAGRNEVSYSVPHGYFAAAFSLTLTASVPDSVIRYTTDGKLPTATSTIYTGPIQITPNVGTTRSGVRIIRAMATHPDAAWSPVKTQTYFFINGVTSPTADGVPGQTNLVASIKNNAVYGPLIDDGLLSLPAVSVVNSSTDLPLAETESSIELIDPQGAEAGFTSTAGIARSGTTSLNYAKGSMSARFRGEYGTAQLNYPVYARHPFDSRGAATSFQELRLRSGSHDTHSWLGTSENPPVPYGSPSVTRSGDAQFIRNIWIEDMQLIMGQPGKRGRMVQMFFNGNYYGIYHIQEHADDDYMGSYFPGNSDDYHFTGGATTGSVHGTESWSTVWSKVKASLSDYSQATRWVDMVNLADYMVLSFYGGNDWDWTAQHNWSAAGPRLPDAGGWKFFSQDQDIALQDVAADSTDQTVPDGIFNRLLSYPDFKTIWRDRIYRHLFNDGALTPAKVAGYYNLRADEIFAAVVPETARWQPSSSVGPLPWDRNGEWTVERNYLNQTYFPQRTGRLLSQFRARGWYPVDAPAMSQRGGTVAAGTKVLLTAPAGTIYYTMDGSDPRQPGGAINPSAVVYDASNNTVNLLEAFDDRAGLGATWKYLVSAADPGPSWREAGFSDAGWSTGKVEAGYGDGDEITMIDPDTDPVAAGVQKGITTLFRNTFNIADPNIVAGLNLRLKRDDGAVVYINGREVMRSGMADGPILFSTTGNKGVNVTDDGNTWFTQALVPGQYPLNQGVNTIAVEIHNATAANDDISFDLELNALVQVTPQPFAIAGPTTVKARVRSQSGEWSAVNEASFVLSGTLPAATDNISLTEIHYHPEGTSQGDAEFLEFKNVSLSAVTLGGVQLSGAVDFTFPAGMVISPGEYVLVAKNTLLFDSRYRAPTSPYYRPGLRVAGTWTGSLSNGSERLVITAPDNSPIFSFEYSDSGAWPGRADGRGSSLELATFPPAGQTRAEKETWLGDPANWRPSAEFHGTPGHAGAGPDNRVAINEVLSASTPPGVDFIELLNTSGVPQAVGGWFLSDSADNFKKYRFPAGTMLAPGAFLVLSGSQFSAAGDPAALVPFSLNSDGDDVFLMEADASGNLLRFADRVEFSLAPPGFSFGRQPDGTGSLELMRTLSSGIPNSLALPGYAAWIKDEFPSGPGSADPSPGADPDGDDLDNLLEFAFKLSPLTPNAPPLTLQPAQGGRPLQVSYTVRTDIPGLRARLEVSPDLSTWDSTESAVERLGEVPQPNAMVTVNAAIRSAPGIIRRFLRVSVSF